MDELTVRGKEKWGKNKVYGGPSAESVCAERTDLRACTVRVNYRNEVKQFVASLLLLQHSILQVFQLLYRYTLQESADSCSPPPFHLVFPREDLYLSSLHRLLLSDSASKRQRLAWKRLVADGM